MNQRLGILLRISFAFLDLMVLNVVYFICQYMFSEHISLADRSQYTYFWGVVNAAWLLVSWGVAIYHEQYILSFERFSRRTMHAFVYFLGAVTLYLAFNKDADLSRLFVLSVLSSFAISLLVNRFLHLGLHQFFLNRDRVTRKIMILGYNERAKKLAAYLEQEPVKTEIVGFCEDPKNIHELTHYPILSGIDDVVETSKQYNVTEIFSTISPEQQTGIYSLINQADQACIRFKIIPDLNQFIRKPVHIDYLNDMPVLSLRKEPLDDVANRMKKRLYDIAFSSLIIILVLSWLIPIISILVWLESRGPIFFIQQRSGKNGKTFNCIKFRSMKVNREANDKQAVKNDARVTRMGKFMRKTNIDELPQFFNVWMGDMSIVGPRPHMLKHTDDYSKLIRQYMIRHFLKPGITGWAQINGYRGETRTVKDMNDRVQYDLWYLENWSLWLDTRVIFLTVFNTFRGEKNAY